MLIESQIIIKNLLKFKEMAIEKSDQSLRQY